MEMRRDREWQRGGGAGEAGEVRPVTYGLRTYTSAEILADAREVLIAHGEAFYRLRATRNGKLILTK